MIIKRVELEASQWDVDLPYPGKQELPRGGVTESIVETMINSNYRKQFPLETDLLFDDTIPVKPQ